MCSPHFRTALRTSGQGLSLTELDYLHDTDSNSIGALLAHMAAVERSFQVLTFEQRLFLPQENELWSTALQLGANGQRSLRGYALEWLWLSASSAVTTALMPRCCPTGGPSTSR